MTISTPPLAGSCAITSSGTLREMSTSARAAACEKITGAFDTASASRIVSAEVCDRSTSMPRRFISRTTCSPNGDRPLNFGVSGIAESAQSVCVLCVSVM